MWVGANEDACSVSKGCLFGGMQIHQSYIVVRAEKSSEYTQAPESRTFKWWILWAVNYISVIFKRNMPY